MDAADRAHAREAAPGAHDHGAVDRSRRIAIGLPTSPLAFGRDRRGLQAEAGCVHCLGRLEHDARCRRAAILQRQIEALEIDSTPMTCGSSTRSASRSSSCPV